MSRILVTGSRGWTNAPLIRTVFVVLETLHHEPMTLVTGACPDGADAIAERIARKMGWEIESHPAQWQTLGKRAGFVRNEEMVASMPRLCVAFWDGSSRGTKHTIDLCEKYGVGLFVYKESEASWQMPDGTFQSRHVGS